MVELTVSSLFVLPYCTLEASRLYLAFCIYLQRMDNGENHQNVIHEGWKRDQQGKRHAVAVYRYRCYRR